MVHMNVIYIHRSIPSPYGQIRVADRGQWHWIAVKMFKFDDIYIIFSTVYSYLSIFLDFSNLNSLILEIAWYITVYRDFYHEF